jgi:tetratricopeptide (TPR) repeat protein
MGDDLTDAGLSTNDVTSTQQLAHLLRQLRRRDARRRGEPELTYRELAARTGWSIGLLAGYFGGDILPPTDRFDVLVALLGAAPGERGVLATARDRVHETRRRPRPAAPVRPVPRQLPPVSFRLAGRTAQLAELHRLARHDDGAATGRIAVVSGTAGVGKTALAVHWAHLVAARFPDGQLFVNLRGFDPDRPPAGPAEAVRDFLDALGVAVDARPVSTTAQANLYRSILADRRVLVVLDNARDAGQVRPLLPGAPGCCTLVTSRTELTGLIAVEGAQRVILDLMPLEEARDLLAHRLGAQRVAAEPAVADEIIEGCARLPLALTVVAARASARPAFPLAAVAEELQRARGSLDPFTGPDTAADTRAAFACSYDHLTETAATAFRRLGGHCGPDLTAPAAASLTGLASAGVRPALAELAHAHLITEHVPGRYAMHDLLRTFAVEQAHRLDTGRERGAAVERMLDHYLHTAYSAAVLMYPARDRVVVAAHRHDATPERLADRDAAQHWLDREHRVLINAVTQAVAAGFDTHAWQLAWTLSDFLDWGGYWHDLAAVQRTALAAARRCADPVGQVHAGRNAARAYIRLGRYDEARVCLDDAIELCQAIDDPLVEAGCHINLSLTLERNADHRGALAHSRQALELFRAADHETGYALSLGIVGWYHALLGDYGQALEHCRRALDLQRRLGGEMPSTLDSLGFAYHHVGRHAEAAASYERAIELYRDAGNRYYEADTLVHLGDCHRATGAADLAVTAWRRALAILDDLRHPAADDLRLRVNGATAGRRPA